VRQTVLAAILAAGAAAYAFAQPVSPEVGEIATTRLAAHEPIDPATEGRILRLDPDHISAADVRDVLSHAPAPRIICLQGSVAMVTMEPFAEFLIAMGYPESRLRNPVDGSMSNSSFADSEKLAGMLAWYYEIEGMMPMLIGHSQGGMMVIKVLYELVGEFNKELSVWNPTTDQSEHRFTITDPLDGKERPVVGLKIPYATALATGRLFRILLGQWAMLNRLRAIPDSVDEFTGFIIEWDPLAGFGSDPYRAIGTAKVHTVMLPASTSHIGMPLAKELALNPITRAWIEAYRPDSGAAPPVDAGVDTSNIIHAADIWYSIRKHWALEAQKLIRARRGGSVAKIGG
jgi:hypothetical protein